MTVKSVNILEDAAANYRMQMSDVLRLKHNNITYPWFCEQACIKFNLTFYGNDPLLTIMIACLSGQSTQTLSPGFFKKRNPVDRNIPSIPFTS